MAFDAHINFGGGTITTAPSPATSGTTATLTLGDKILTGTPPFNATVFPSGSTPTDANAEIVRITAINTGTRVVTFTRTQESSNVRTIVVGDQISGSITKKTLTDIETAFTSNGSIYVTTTGSDSNDGLSWGNAKATVPAAITALPATGGMVNIGPGGLSVSSSLRSDTIAYSGSGNVFNDTSAVVGDVGKYVVFSNIGRVPKITSVVAGVSFTVDVLPTTTTATTAKIVVPAIVVPEGVYLQGVGPNFNHQLTAGSATSQVSTQISDSGTGITVLIQGANSPAGGSTRYGISNMSILGNTGNLCGLFVGNGAWLIDSRNLELSSHGIAGLMLDGNINSHNFSNLVTYGNGTATATVATGGVYTHPYNAAGSASCNFYNAFFSANYGFGIFDGDTGGSYGVVLWDPQFNSQQATLFANSGTSMVLQSKGTGDGMGICIGGWSETAALYDVITSGYVTIVGMRMHTAHAYHWIVNGGVANAIGCTFEGATTATFQLNSSGVVTWNNIKVTTDPLLYGGGPAVASLPAMGTSGGLFGNALTANGITNTGDFTVKDAATATKAMRFQTSAASLDVAFGGSSCYFSNWTGAGFTGTQNFYFAFDTAGNFDAFKVWRWHSAPFGTTMMTLDPGNTTTPLQIHGGLSVDGATSGTTSVVPTAVAGTTTLTLPAATDTLVGKATTDTFTNKTFDTAGTGNVFKINGVGISANTGTGANVLATGPAISNPTFTGFGGLSPITADTAAINTTETVLTSITIPTAAVGTVYRITCLGTCTASAANLSTFTLRAGTAGTTADASIATGTMTSATAGTAVGFQVVLFYTMRTNGTTGNGSGSYALNNTGVTGIETRHSVVNPLTTSATFNTTTATKLTITYKTAAATTTSTFTNAIIEIVKP